MKNERWETYVELYGIVEGMKKQAIKDGDGVRADKCRKVKIRLDRLFEDE